MQHATLPGAQRAWRAPRAAHGGAQPAPVVIRPLEKSDVSKLAAFFRNLSPHSRHRRFHGAVNELPPALMAQLAQPDAEHQVALLAVVARGGRETVLGEVRYAITGTSRRAEFAIAVADAAQGLGLGGRLMRGLLHCAQANRIAELYGDVLPDNRAMLALARGCGFAVRRDPDDARLLRVERALSVPRA
jgi:RimJ/RimL family protein N-acetyltransferase